VEVEPAERGAGTEVEYRAPAAVVPAVFRDAILAGINDGIFTGVLGKYPLTDVKVRVVGGEADAENSTDVAFRTAAVMAFREAIGAANAELLEPIMSLEIVTPVDYMGDVLGDLSSRRGKVHEMTARGEVHMIRAGVPLSELFGYSTAIRSLTRGRASYTMEPELFEIVPKAIREELLNR